MQYNVIKADVEKGNIKLPKFQREFVWDLKKSAALLDSIIKGYPIGAFILWKTKEKFRVIRDLGNKKFASTPKGDFAEYILDGQQRLTSLLACFEGLQVPRKGIKKPLDFSKIYVNLIENEDSEIVTADIKGKKLENLISVTDLMSGYSVWEKWPREHHKKIDVYAKQLDRYDYTIIRLTDASILVAAEVFTRINVGGKPLDVFEIMVAKTFDAKRNFDLSEKYEELEKELDKVDYRKLKREVILQAVAMVICKACSKKAILNIKKDDFINRWGDVVKAIHKAIDYFRTEYAVPIVEILPYHQLVVPFAYFFYHHKKNPSGEMKKNLQDFFWMCSLSGRYVEGLNSSLAQDIKRIDSIRASKPQKYEWRVDYSINHIDISGQFRLGSSYIKAILCILNFLKPKSFQSGSPVIVSKDSLSQSNFKNYHHFFPRAYLKKTERYDDAKIHHIANITLLDSETNQIINDKKPSEYMGEFQKANPRLPETMKTHLIGDFDEFGISDNDYDKFFKARLKLISQEIEKRIVKPK